MDNPKLEFDEVLREDPDMEREYVHGKLTVTVENVTFEASETGEVYQLSSDEIEYVYFTDYDEAGSGINPAQGLSGSELTFCSLSSVDMSVRCLRRGGIDESRLKDFLKEYYVLDLMANDRPRRLGRDGPRLPVNAFMYWLCDNRRMKEHPDPIDDPNESWKAALKEWRRLPDRSKWEKMSAESLERYKREAAVYLARKAAAEDCGACTRSRL